MSPLPGTQVTTYDHFERAARVRGGEDALRRVGGGLLLVLLLIGCLALSLRPRYVYLNGDRVPLRQVSRISDAASRLHLSLAPGNLVDARGEVLVARGGRPALIFRNGELVPPTARLHGGDSVYISPGRDRTEPLLTKVTTLAPVGRVHNSALGPSPVSLAGLRREQRGQFSGKLAAVQIASVSPVPLPAANRKLMALTFDDGPSPSYTPSILALLAKYGARATFFELGGCVSNHPDLTRKVYAAGHELAVHTWSHWMMTKNSTEALTADLRRCLDLYTKVLGGPVPIRWMRPPYGATNAHVRAAIEAVGLRHILWSVDTNDWRRPGGSVIAQRILAQARPGAVVLMHDGGGPREGTVEGVRQALPVLLARGYSLVTLSELMGATNALSTEAIFTINGEQFRVKPLDPPASLTVDGAVLELTTPILACNGQLLLPAVPTLDKLGITCVYETAIQSLRLSAPSGEYVVPLDSLRLQHGDQELTLQYPSLLYNGRAYLPLSLVTRLSGGAALWEDATRSLQLFSPGASPAAAPTTARWLPRGGWSLLPA
ncbi:MAG TPA: polysaccharide deacetylase family protein [Armatimonadota bacterium]|jgi:peptidoglycan/xylan/chitin deacetylase (PgdA/CDA1 family)